MSGEVEVTGRYRDFKGFVASLKKLHEMGFGDRLITFSPVMRHELEEALPAGPSGVRYFTLIGSLLGCLAGVLLTVITSLRMNVITGGKPIISVPPFVIISFELTILIGLIVTFLGFLFWGRLPALKAHESYDRKFSEDEFAVVLSCLREDAEEVTLVMRENGASEVRVE
ncbi:MAG: DUF3341 domain-containing protein [Candidatus Glassbacteria bacterium]